VAEVAFVFPGQGSQYVGMGQDVCESYPPARAVFDEADSLLGFPLSRLCFSGPEEDLNDTVNTQPAVFVASLALWRVLEPRLPGPARFFAGHSLGEYAALVASDAVEFSSALSLVRERGRLMQEAGEQSRGGMAAVLGLDGLEVEEICRRAEEATGGMVQVANFNCPGQTVISGSEEALAQAISSAEAAGAARVVKLAVSIAAHSPLMLPAEAAFRTQVEAASFRQPRTPIVGNVSAEPLLSSDRIVSELVGQLTAPVRWSESVQFMVNRGVETVVEVGPGKVLTGLMKRIDRRVKRVSVGDQAAIESFVGA